MKKTIIDVSLHNNCNYLCHGCIAKSHRVTWQDKNSTSDQSNFGCCIKHGHSIQPSHLLTFIQSRWSPDDCIVQFTGGEPLLYDSLIYLIKELGPYKKVIVSNGYFLKAFTAALPSWPAFSIKWKISFHPEMRSMEHLLKDIEPLQRHKNDVIFNYYIHPRDKESGLYQTHLQELKNCGYKFHVNPFKGEYNNDWYDKFHDIYKDIPLFENMPWKDFVLFGINPDGQIRQCYKQHCGDIYEGWIKTLNPDTPVCVHHDETTGQDDLNCSLCDCYNSVRALYPEEFK